MKTNKPQANLNKMRKAEAQISKIGNEKREIITNTTEIK
jgi:hypothetical protein